MDLNELLQKSENKREAERLKSGQKMGAKGGKNSQNNECVKFTGSP